MGGVFGNIQPKVVPCIQPASIKDVFLHSLFARVALNDNSTIEFQTKYDPGCNQLELILPPNAPPIFDKTTGVQQGPNLQAYVSWFVGSNGGGGGAPSGPAGGVLTGTYPNPGLADGAVSVSAKLANGIVTEAKLLLADNATGNVSTLAHGFAPKLPGDATKFLDGTGVWSTPAGSGGMTIGGVVTGGTATRLLWEDTGHVLADDAQLTWDKTAKRLIVGTTAAEVFSGFEGVTVTKAVAGGHGVFIRNTSTDVAAGAAIWLMNDDVGNNVYGGLFIGSTTYSQPKGIGNEIAMWAGGGSPGIALNIDGDSKYIRFTFNNTGAPAAGHEWGRILDEGGTDQTLLVGKTARGPGFGSWIEIGPNRDSVNRLTITNGSNTANAFANLVLWHTDARYSGLFMLPPAASGVAGGGLSVDQLTLYTQGFTNGLNFVTNEIGTPIIFTPGTSEFGRIVKIGAGDEAFLIGKTARQFAGLVEVGASRDAANYVAITNGNNTTNAFGAYLLWNSNAKYGGLVMAPAGSAFGAGADPDSLLIYSQGFTAGIALDTQNNAPIKLKTAQTTRYQIDGNGNMAWFSGTPAAQQTVSGAKLPSDVVMASLLAALGASGYNLIIDTTT